MNIKDCIYYRKGYKYQLAKNYRVNISIKPKDNIETDFINLNIYGKLLIKAGYAWDGPSGPVKDTDKNMRASLVHDALYQLMRNNKLDLKTYRKMADQEFRNICIADGVSVIRAFIYYRALQKFGKYAASPENKKKIHRTPK